MKKLMIAACAVALAAGVQAASITWGTSGSFYDTAGAPDWNTVAAGTTAYLVFASSYSQTDLVNDFAGAGVNMTKLTAVTTGTVGSDGTVSEVSGTTALSGSQNAYVVLFEGSDYMFVSDAITRTIDELMGSDFTFAEAETGDIWSMNQAADGYSQAGWYQSVPEPTSGLLLLLGVAGLALRRRRA